MSKLVSPMTGKIMGINVQVGQLVTANDEVLTIEAMNSGNGTLRQLEEYEEYPRYQMIYDYFTSRFYSI